MKLLLSLSLSVLAALENARCRQCRVPAVDGDLQDAIEALHRAITRQVQEFDQFATPDQEGSRG